MKSQREVLEQKTIETIESLHAVIKVVSAPPNSKRCLQHVLDQLSKPDTYRPVKTINNAYRHRAFNPKTGLWEYRPKEGKTRGTAKLTVFTKKSSVTLLPADGRMHLFKPKHGHPVGLIFDVRLCHLKNEKYIFDGNGHTDDKWWLKQEGITEAQQEANMLRSLSLAEIQHRLRANAEAGITPNWNEFAIGLNLDGLLGMFATQNTLVDRLNALIAQREIAKQLEIDLPLFVITPTEGIKVYHQEWQQSDMRLASRWDNLDYPIEFVAECKALHQALKPVAIHNDASDQTVRAFFLGYQIPRDVKALALYHLSMVDLVNMRIALSSQASMKNTIALIDKARTRIMFADLAKTLEMIAKLGIGTDKVWPTTKRTYSTYQSLLNDHQELLKQFILIALTPENPFHLLTHRLPITQSAILHYCNNKISLNQLLADAMSAKNNIICNYLLEIGADPFCDANHFFEVIKHADLYILKTILNKYKPPYLTSSIKVWENHSWQPEHGDYIIDRRKVRDITLCPLVQAALMRDHHVVAEVAKAYPSHLTSALTQLKKMVDIYSADIDSLAYHNSITIGFVFAVSAGHLRHHYVKLLRQLKPSHAYQHTIGYEDKRLIESQLLAEINCLKTNEEVDHFWEAHKDSVCLNQRRHPLFDSIFRKNMNEQTIKSVVRAALQTKRESFEGNQDLQLRNL
jgi:hypothetical protein